MSTFRDHFEDLERERKTLEIFSSEPIPEIEAQFATRNVSVEQRSLPPEADRGFVIVRGPDDEFQGSTDLRSFDAILSPETHPPWEISAETDTQRVFDFLDDTLFTSFDRTQMLATAREIEERAWRTASGSLYTGFQDRTALRDQRDVYDEFLDREGLAVTVYARDEWDVDGSAFRAVESDDEIGAFWFVLFDDERDGAASCALVAEEREPGSYYGFWTYDPQIVDELVAHVRRAHGSP